MKRQTYKMVIARVTVLVVAVALIGGAVYINNSAPHAQAAGESVVFGLGGDFSGETGDAATTMEVAGESGLDFWFLNGDFDQGYEGEAIGFCNAIKANINIATTPVLLLSGNHEAEDAPGGSQIEDYTETGCLPNPLGSRIVESPYIDGDGVGTTNYGKEYYVDYPAINPVLRIVTASPQLDFRQGDGPTYSYTAGSNHYNWVSQAITDAKNSGMWVILAYHKPYLDVGTSHGGDDGSDIEDLYNLALDTEVDLMVNGHEHMYQRSKQLAHGTGCTTITQNSSYDSDCVTHAGTVGDPYVKGEGTVQIVNAASGSDTRQADTDDDDYNYFTKMDSDGSSKGFIKFTVSSTELSGVFVDTNDGGFSDSFSINAPADTTSPNVSLTAPSAGATLSGAATLTATASDNVGVTSVEFYQGSTLLGTDTTSPYSYSWNTTGVTNGSYNLTAQAYDAATNSATSTAINVTVDNTVTPPADTTPPTVSLTAPATGATLSGTATLTASASDDTGVTSVEFYHGVTKLGEDFTAPYSFAWDTTSVANGVYNVRATAYDAASNSASSAYASITVANTSETPTVSTTKFAAPYKDNTATSVSLTGLCSVSDAGSTTTIPGAIDDTKLISAFAFTVNCSSNGATLQVEADLGKQLAIDKLTVYKNQSDGSVKDVTSKVTITDRQVEGVTHTVITYSVIDGSVDDTDGTVNGVIVDPVYVMYAGATTEVTTTTTTGELANTGTSTFFVACFALVLVLGGAGVVAAQKQRS